MKNSQFRRLLKFILLTTIIGGGFYFARKRMDQDYQAGKTFENWKKEYEKEQSENARTAGLVLDEKFHFIGLELIHIGPGEKYFSRFGHVLLRFVSSGDTPEQDLTVSFMIDANDYQFDNWAGLVGGKYANFPQIKTLKEHMNTYVKKEKRSLTRYIIPIKPEWKTLLKANLRSYIKNPKQLGSYAFWDNSCTNALNKYLMASNIPTIDIQNKMIFPWDLLEIYSKQSLIPHPPLSHGDLKAAEPELYQWTE